MQNKSIILGKKVLAQRYSMVKLPRAERGDKGNVTMWIAGQRRKRKEMRRL